MEFLQGRGLRRQDVADDEDIEPTTYGFRSGFSRFYSHTQQPRVIETFTRCRDACNLVVYGVTFAILLASKSWAISGSLKPVSVIPRIFLSVFCLLHFFLFFVRLSSILNVAYVVSQSVFYRNVFAMFSEEGKIRRYIFYFNFCNSKDEKCIFLNVFALRQVRS